MAGGNSVVHELSLMEAVRRQALEALDRHGGERIVAITLRIGALAGVEPDCLAMAFEVVMAESLAAGARLQIESVPAEGRCRSCGQVFAVRAGLLVCPGCGGSASLERGRELQLVSLDVT